MSSKEKKELKELESQILTELQLPYWGAVPYFDDYVKVKTRQTLDNYDATKFFKENREKLQYASTVLSDKQHIVNRVKAFLDNNDYITHKLYPKVSTNIKTVLNNASAYRVKVEYISPAGKQTAVREVVVYQSQVDEYIQNPQLLMSKTEYAQHVKEQQRAAELSRQMEEAQRQREAIVKYQQMEKQTLAVLGFTSWPNIGEFDEEIVVSSRAAFDKYDHISFFKEHKDKVDFAATIIEDRKPMAKHLNTFLKDDNLKTEEYYQITKKTVSNLYNQFRGYRLSVKYISSAGNLLDHKTILVTSTMINAIKKDPALLMSKTEYNQMMREWQKAEKDREKETIQKELDAKRHSYYDAVNQVIDVANATKGRLLNKNDKEEFDKLIARLYDGTVNSIQKIKTVDSQEWTIIKGLIASTFAEIQAITEKNDKILNYYKSPAFLQLKQTCDTLMSSQREFNEYINDKANSISQLFGTRVVRNETQTNDTYNYIRPYQKTVTPFTAEVSSSVFASAENKPIEYIIKQFYPNKNLYPEQIKKLHLLVEELETLREAKQIIENYKTAYKKYLNNVPAFILEQDEAGFYSRLGFAHIDESVLVVEYKFAYTSDGGMAQRSFTVPMTEETIIELIHSLEGKLTASAFAKEQRQMMTKKLREQIKIRDNYTCRLCGNSTHKEPNLLLEIDHIKPVALGGCTEESNLQTLCWKCNRSKGAKY